MPPLVGFSFAATFDFARPIAADHRDADGELVEAAIDQPRFDHDEAGVPLGLLVEAGPYFGAADRATVPNGDWVIFGKATVLHEMGGEEGLPVRRAYYSIVVASTVNALLATAGHHRRIGAIPGFLRNLGGFVRYRDEDWALPGYLGDGEGAILCDGSEPARPLIEG